MLIINDVCVLHIATNTSLSLPVVVGSIVGICIVATLLLFLQIIPSFLFRVSSHQNKEFVDI